MLFRNRLAGSFLDLVGRREIRKALREIYRIMLEREARHLADYRLGKEACAIATEPRPFLVS
jgi:hypothetical protein